MAATRLRRAVGLSAVITCRPLFGLRFFRCRRLFSHFISYINLHTRAGRGTIENECRPFPVLAFFGGLDKNIDPVGGVRVP